MDTGFALEAFLAVLFTVDFFLRWYVYHNRLFYLQSSVFPWIDLACIVPTYVEWVGGASCLDAPAVSPR